MPGWDELPELSHSELSTVSDRWFRGYFPASHRMDETVWRRDYDELQRRDLFLFALGEVQGKTVLDVACGSGLYLVLLAMMGATVSLISTGGIRVRM